MAIFFTTKTSQMILKYKTNIRKSLRLFEYLQKSIWLFLLGMFFVLLTAIVGLYFPLLAGKMFGYFGQPNVTSQLFKDSISGTGLELLFLLVFQGLISFGRIYVFTIVTENLLKKLRVETFNKLVQMPMNFFSENKVADLNSRLLSDISVISDAFTINISEIVRQTIVGIGGIVLLINYTGWEVTKWFLVIIPPIAVITILYGKKIRTFSKSFQNKISESSVIVSEALTGISSVKAFTNEKMEISKYDSITNEIRRYGIKFGLMRGLFFTFIITCVFGSIFFILYQMLLLKNSGALSSENFGIFMMLSFFVASSLGSLPEQFAAIQHALGATDRIFEIIDRENESINLAPMLSNNRIKGDLEFKNIQFSYANRNDFVVLKNISFNVMAGDTVALVGSSGSGKSTLASLALRFYEPTAGEYTIDGIKSVDYQLTDLRNQMAIVPQDVLLFGGSIKENILYGRPEASTLDIIHAAKQANAYDFIMGFPNQFETIVGDRGIQLSGGQRQRIAIARAILNNPSILILDEATSSLDSESERLVQDALDKLMIGRTSIVIAHRLSTIKNANKIIVLQKGEVVEVGTHKELIINENGLYYKLIKLQFELS